MRFEDTMTNDALEMATSLPDPMAIPMSLAERAFRLRQYVKRIVQKEADSQVRR